MTTSHFAHIANSKHYQLPICQPLHLSTSFNGFLLILLAPSYQCDIAMDHSPLLLLSAILINVLKSWVVRFFSHVLMNDPPLQIGVTLLFTQDAVPSPAQ